MDSYSIYGFVILALICYYIFKNFFSTGDEAPNPFERDDRIPLKKKITDPKERDAVLKQGFKADKLPKNLDAIVIGSGIGGISTASLLSKCGKRVLVLEQHDQAGGCCHTFIEKGYEFDVGIHYIGDMLKPSISKTYLDQISEGQIIWEEMCEEYDRVVFKEPNSKLREYPFVSNLEKQKAFLKKSFPGDAQGIDKFYDLVIEISQSYTNTMLVKFIPLWVVKLMVWTGTIKFLTVFWEWNKKSAKDVVDSLVSNQELRDLLCYCFGDYGTPPSQAGFPFQAMLLAHFTQGGAAYPVGGASEIGFNIIPTIEKSGGRVLVRAKVTNILMNSAGRAVGVKVSHGTSTTDIYAPLIISDAGLFNTFKRLLPQSVSSKSRLWPFLSRAQHGVCAINLFVGINCSQEKLGVANKKNFWVFTKNNIDKAFFDYLHLSKDEFEDEDIPIMFISFPSTKDPTWEERYPNKTTMVAVTFSNYEWFAEWENKPCQRRGDDYEAVKKTLAHKIIEHAADIFPNIRDKIDYINMGSPLSNNFYLGSPRGEIYGLDHNRSRFAPMNHAMLRPKTDVPGLFLTGQDISTCGFAGALMGGLLCAQQILGRQLIKDLGAIHKSIYRKQKDE